MRKNILDNKRFRIAVKFSISIAIIFAIGSILANVNAQPSNFTITPGNLTGPVINCANG